MSNEQENKKLNSAKNNLGANAYQSYIASLIEGQETLKSSTNDVNVRDDFARDMKPEEFTEKGTDYPSDESIGANPELEKYPETERFAKSHEIDENEIRKNKKANLPSGGGCK